MMPSPSVYQDALQHPQLCFADPQLRHCQVEQAVWGPRLITGGVAAAAPVRIGNTRWAVRCFTKDIPADQHERYERISEHLASCHLPYTAQFVYVSKGILVGGSWYPIVKMEWVDGDLLGAYVERLALGGDRNGLAALAKRWLDLVITLQSNRIGHGDLQHGNVLVAPDGRLRIIDYDGMFVPALSGRLSPELGHENYQHPRRSSRDYGPDIDNFSAIAIYAAVLALVDEPTLWKQLQRSDCILWLRDDFADPKSSWLFTHLASSPRPLVANLARNLKRACVGALPAIPDLNAAGQPPPLSVAFRLAWVRPEVQREREVRVHPVYKRTATTVNALRRFDLGWVRFLSYAAVQVPVGLASLTGHLPWFAPIMSAVAALPAAARLPDLEFETTVPETTLSLRSDEQRTVVKAHEIHPGHGGAVNGVAFVRNGALLVSAGSDGYVGAWTPTGERRAFLRHHEQRIAAIAAVAPDWFATASWDGTVRVWRADANGALSAETTWRPQSSAAIQVLDALPGTTLLGIVLEGGEIMRWDWRRGTSERLGIRAARPARLRFLGTPEDLVVGATDGWLHLFLANGTPAPRPAHRGSVTDIAVAPDGSAWASAGEEGSILVWSRPGLDGKTQPRMRIESGVPARCLAFAPDGGTLVGGCDDGAVRFWSVRDGKLAGRVPLLQAPIVCVAVSPGADVVVGAAEAGLALATL